MTKEPEKQLEITERQQKVSVLCVCVYLVVEVAQCGLVFRKLLHKSLWKIPDP